MTFPREGKFTSSHFFASKDVMGLIDATMQCPDGPGTKLEPETSVREGRTWAIAVRMGFV